MHKMRVGLIDVDGHRFPNLPLMKLSAWHKARGDRVEWYFPLVSGHCDVVYMSKVFSFSPDYLYDIDADQVIRGGSGYCIGHEATPAGSRETYSTFLDRPLPHEIEHIYPDYSIYPELAKDTAYGFLTRGCPNDCPFCRVSEKEGRHSRKVADLSEFWHGQRDINLLDPNLTACPQKEELLWQLVDSGARVDFSSGMDVRFMSEGDMEIVRKIRCRQIHFAWDRYDDGPIVKEKLRAFREVTGWDRHKVTVYILVNFDTSLEQDLERIYQVRDLGLRPYVMIYGKKDLPEGDVLFRLQRYVNNPMVFNSRTCRTFTEYDRRGRG